MSRHAFSPPELPEGLEPLVDLALDLRWTWSHEADSLWRALDDETWTATRNPWLLLQDIPRARLIERAADPAFRQHLDRVLELRRASLAPRAGDDAQLSRPVAYFSLEFALGEAIPLYAGGLGVLAGDHLKAASDLAVPLVAVGLLYQEGYFRQRFDAAGRQEELYPYNDPVTLPIQPTLAPSGEWLTVPVQLPGRTLHLRAWRATVGRVTLHLLDSNVPINDPADRGITGKLYGDGPEMRLRQEMVLGIGGWRLLDALGVDPGAAHLNEGHAAFAILERARSVMARHQLGFWEALAATRAGNVFTTHTPVAAGFDEFSPQILAKYFPGNRGYLAELGIAFTDLLALGRAPGRVGPDEPFRPSYLAVRGSARINAVSALHAQTSREIFAPLFPRWPTSEIPVGHVTNGVHVPSWDSAAADALWTRACGADRWRGSTERLTAAIEAVDDRSLWAARGEARAELVRHTRERLADQLARRGATPAAVEAAARTLDPDVLTIGFARRFATYKRPDLLLRDRAALRRLLSDRARPVQLVVAGKAHPADGEGKALVETWARFVAEPDVRSRCVFLEDYDLSVAQEMVQGVDVWLNTPRRPWEACGTSGMKVLVNGGLNVSALDGWWAEAYEPDVGWAIGDPGASSDDARDAAALMSVLQEQVVPLFYDRDAEGLPRAWLRRVRASLSRLTPRFSANRMLREYLADHYRPAEADLLARMADGAAGGRALADWSARLRNCWAGLRFGALDARNGQVSVELFLNEVRLDDVAVELYAEPARAGEAPAIIPMTQAGPLPGTTHGFLFRAAVDVGRRASDWTPRVRPAGSVNQIPVRMPGELPLIAWQR
jgi:starch phosphorylase